MLCFGQFPPLCFVFCLAFWILCFVLLRCYPLCLHQLSTSLCYNNEDVRGVSTKILLGFLAVTLVAPTALFSHPQKAEALLSLAQCFAAKAVGAAKGAAVAAPNAI